MDILELATFAMKEAQALGAEEVTASASRNTELSMTRRAGKLEQASQASSMELAMSLLVGDRYSSHSTSDIRPDAIRTFLRRAVAATEVLEAEPERRLPDAALCGAANVDLDAWDATWFAYSVDQRREEAQRLEEAVDALPGRSTVKSSTVYIGDSEGESARVMSNGFLGRSKFSSFGAGVEITLEEPGGRRPEAMSWASTRHRADLPTATELAREAWEKVDKRRGSRSAPSGRYPMLLDAQVVGRVLGIIGGPLSGSELHQGRSFLAGKRGERIGSELLTIRDEPLIPRGLASRRYDGDGLTAKPMVVVEKGILQNYYISTYYGRKLGMPATTGSHSNWIVPAGSRSVAEILSGLDRCIVVAGFLGGNSNGLTGDFSFGVHGQLFEKGEVVQNVSEMNVSGNATEIFNQLVEAASDVWLRSGIRSASLLFDGVQFSGG